MPTPSPSPHSQAFSIITAALEELGFHEDGEEGGFHRYTTYRNRHWVLVDDSAGISLEQQVETVLKQEGDIDAGTLERAITQVRDRLGGG